MPTVAEIWSAQFGPTGNRKTAGQLLAEARNGAADAVAHATQLEVTVAALAERVDQLTLAGVDLDQLAERVADKLAARLKE